MLRFLVGNKCDLEAKRQITFDQGKELAKQYNIPFLETSARDTLNIEELFMGITKNFLDKQVSGNANVKKDPIGGKNIKNTSKNIKVDTISENTKKKGGCC